MRSNAAFEAWEKKYADLMQKGKVGKADAAAKLALGQKNVLRARTSLTGDDPDQALVSAETAMVNAADAVLALNGYRLRGKTGAHEARFEFPGLPVEFVQEQKRIRAARDNRNPAMYDFVGGVSAQLASDVSDAADRLVKAVASLVG